MPYTYVCRNSSGWTAGLWKAKTKYTKRTRRREGAAWKGFGRSWRKKIRIVYDDRNNIVYMFESLKFSVICLVFLLFVVCRYFLLVSNTWDILCGFSHQKFDCNVSYMNLFWFKVTASIFIIKFVVLGQMNFSSFLFILGSLSLMLWGWKTFLEHQMSLRIFLLYLPFIFCSWCYCLVIYVVSSSNSLFFDFSGKKAAFKRNYNYSL